MADPLITQEQLMRRISKQTMFAIFDDENSDDEQDETLVANVQLVIDDATSKVRGSLGRLYDPDTFTTVSTETATELRRIALDIAVAMCAQRFPEVMQRSDTYELMKQAERQLEQIRKGLASLGTNSAPEPAANQGVIGSAPGGVTVGGSSSTVCSRKFSDDWGEF